MFDAPDSRPAEKSTDERDCLGNKPRHSDDSDETQKKEANPSIRKINNSIRLCERCTLRVSSGERYGRRRRRGSRDQARRRTSRTIGLDRPRGEAPPALFVRACASVTQSIDSLVACRGKGPRRGGGGVSPQNTNTASHACAMQPHGMHSIRT